MSSAGSEIEAPSPDEIEISLFGPGFGESMAVHLGDGRWMIVDSCVSPSMGRPALDYLAEINVDCRTAVVAVVATHWHDDHVRGFAEVVSQCEGATVFLGSALQQHEFLTLVASPPTTTRIPPGAREFAAVIATLRERRNGGRSADVVSRLVTEQTIVDESAMSRVVALSPSSAAVEDAISAFADLLPEPRRPQLRIPAPSKNAASVVLWVEGAGGAALLGADLEAEHRNDRGWGRVVALGERGPAGLVKVPHHGGQTAHDERMWDRLLRVRPQALLTPWTLGGNLLPDEDDTRRICELAPEAVIVGRASASPKRLESAVERSLKGVAKGRRVVGHGAGHVRARCGPADSGNWRVDLMRSAERMCSAA